MQPSYRPDRAADSDRAHAAAIERIYPKLWPGRRFTLDRAVGTDLDYDYGVDYVAHVAAVGLRKPLRIYVQERFRTPQSVKQHNDVTITEWNTRTGKPAEVYKISAHLFVYGTFDEATGAFRKVVVFYVDRVLQLLATNRLRYDWVPANGKGQSFLGVMISELIGTGCVALYLPTADDELIRFEQLDDGQLRMVLP